MSDSQMGFVPSALVLFIGWVGNKDNQLHKSGRYNGKMVYPDWNYENMVIPDNAYLCNLKYTGSADCYHAEVISKFTPQDMQDYLSDHPDAAADIISRIQSMKDSGCVQTSSTVQKSQSDEVPSFEKDSVYRISFNELKSDMFTEDRYTVMLSPNGRKVSISPNRYGRTSCRNGVITIGGLEKRNKFTNIGKIRYSKNKERFDLVLD